MLLESAYLLVKLYYRPLDAMSGIMDLAAWLFGLLAVLLISCGFYIGVTSHLYHGYQAYSLSRTTGLPVEGNVDDEDAAMVIETSIERPLPIVGRLGWRVISFSASAVLSTVAALAFLYVPATIVLMNLLERLGSFEVVIRRDYAPLLTCTLMAWAAAHLPATLFSLIILKLNPPLPLLLGLWVISKIGFAVLMVFAMRTVFSARVATATVTVGLAWISDLLQGCLLWFAAPFTLLWLYSYFRGEINDIGVSYRHQRSFRRSLQAATLNPQDAEAHYQLGLIYQRRHQRDEARASFQRAVEIDKREIDAAYQLGRMAREDGQLQAAIDLFDRVVSLDDKHHQSEVWREIGVTYLTAKMFDDARAALSRYIERRPYDPEGLYYYGRVLTEVGELTAAREMLERARDAANTAPYYHRNQLRGWRNLAEKELAQIAQKERTN